MAAALRMARWHSSNWTTGTSSQARKWPSDSCYEHITYNCSFRKARKELLCRIKRLDQRKPPCQASRLKRKHFHFVNKFLRFLFVFIINSNHLLLVVLVEPYYLLLLIIPQKLKQRLENGPHQKIRYLVNLQRHNQLFNYQMLGILK